MDTVALEERVVRIFLSSTFLDFAVEREALAVYVLPELRRRAAARFVHVVSIDLQWGVSVKEARENKQLERCIREIDRCGRYFLGLLGNRYGWAPPPEAFTAPVLEARPWLGDCVGKSITEIEILCGAIHPATENVRPIIFLRDALAAEYQSLADRLRACGLDLNPLASMEDFVRSATDLLWAQIDADFPDEKVSLSADEDRCHRAFGRDRSWAVGSEYGDKASGHSDEYLAACERGAAPMFGGPPRRSFAIHAPTTWDAIALTGKIAERVRTETGARVFEHYPPAGRGDDADADFLAHVARFTAMLLGKPEPSETPSTDSAMAALTALARWKEQSGDRLFLLMSGVEALSETVAPVIERMALSLGGLCIVFADDSPWQRAITEWQLPWTFMNFGHENFIYFIRRYIERYGKAMDQKPFYDLAQQLNSNSLLAHKQVCDFLIRFARFADLRHEIEQIRTLSARTPGDAGAIADVRCRYFANRAREQVGAPIIDRFLAALIEAPNGATDSTLRGRSDLSAEEFARAQSALCFALDEWRDRIWLSTGKGSTAALRADGETEPLFPVF